jgi:hypothetical protein
MFIGDGYDIPYRILRKASRDNLMRLAKWINLNYGLEEMSTNQLSRLIRWKITRGRIRK